MGDFLGSEKTSKIKLSLFIYKLIGKLAFKIDLSLLNCFNFVKTLISY